MELTSLLDRWCVAGDLGASDERRLARLLKSVFALRRTEKVTDEDLFELLEPYSKSAQLSREQTCDFIRRIKPLLAVRELTADEKQDLADLFDRYRMRLWSKLRRSISAMLESRFEPDDVLSESYIRAELRWSTRPENPEKCYTWLYGLVHEQFCDMVRKVNAIRRGGHVKHERIPDILATEIAQELCQSRTGASTFVARKEFEAKLQNCLMRTLSPIDRQIFVMRIFDSLEYTEIAEELTRRGEKDTSCAGDLGRSAERALHGGIVAQAGQGGEALSSEAIRKRFARAVARITDAVLVEFPELLDTVSELGSRNGQPFSRR